jgi:hypothetical protein
MKSVKAEDHVPEVQTAWLVLYPGEGNITFLLSTRQTFYTDRYVTNHRVKQSHDATHLKPLKL